MSNNDMLFQAASKLSAKTIIIFLAILVAYIIFLTSFSVYTGRQVDFFPPKIGPENNTRFFSQISDVVKELEYARETFSKRTIRIEKEIIDLRMQIAKMDDPKTSTQRINLQILERKHMDEVKTVDEQYIKFIDEKIESVNVILRRCE